MTKQSALLARLARERGLTFGPETTNQELHDMLGPTPPSKSQADYIRVLAEFLGYNTDFTAKTYAQARKALELLETAANEKVLLDTGWQVDDVLAWRGGYWEITGVRPARLFYRLDMRPVFLGQVDGETEIVKEMSGESHAPQTVATEHGFKVDMTTWPPPPPPPRPAGSWIENEEDDELSD